MRRSRFSEGQIAMALRQAEAGTPVAEISRKLEISETTQLRSAHLAKWASGKKSRSRLCECSLVRNVDVMRRGNQIFSFRDGGRSVGHAEGFVIILKLDAIAR